MTFLKRSNTEGEGEKKKTTLPFAFSTESCFIKASGKSPMLDICKPVPLTDKFPTCVLLKWTADHPSLVKSVPVQVDDTKQGPLNTLHQKHLTILSEILPASQNSLLNFSRIALVTL